MRPLSCPLFGCTAAPWRAAPAGYIDKRHSDSLTRTHTPNACTYLTHARVYTIHTPGHTHTHTRSGREREGKRCASQQQRSPRQGRQEDTENGTPVEKKRITMRMGLAVAVAVVAREGRGGQRETNTARKQRWNDNHVEQARMRSVKCKREGGVCALCMDVFIGV